MLYAVVDRAGEPIAEGLTEAEAAHEILTYDGAQYELRADDDGEGWILWTRHQTANRHWTPTIFGSWQTDRDAAEAVILAEVVRAADTFNGWTAGAVPQAEWGEMQTRLAAEGVE
jgi:hypothetical protein